MVRDIRIKTLRFPEDYASSDGTISSATTGSFVSDSPINGEILDVQLGVDRAGSISLTFGESKETFFSDNTSSGTNASIFRPYAPVALNDGTIPNGSEVVNYVTADHIVLNLTAFPSGTNPINFKLRYR